MKALFAAALLVVGAAAPATTQDSASIFPFPYEVVQLENGFRAYLIRAGAPGQIAYVSIVRTGSRDEVEAGKSGFAHFFEHMMFRGTEKYPQYDQITTQMGAARNASTSNDQTMYYLVAGSEYLEQIIDLESDRFQNLKYTDPDFRTEAGAILGEYQQGAREPGRFLSEKLLETAYLQHTYRHTVIGYEADVRAMPEGYEYSRSFYDRFYRPENVVLVLAGDFDVPGAKQLIAKYYAGWRPGYVPPAITPEPPQTAPREQTIEYPGRTLPVLSINYKAPAWSVDDTLSVALTVLGDIAFGSNSEIYRKLVLREGRLQSLGARFGLGRDPALVGVQATIARPDDVEAVKQELYGTAQQFQTTLVDPALLARTRSAIKYGFLMRLETAQDVAFSATQPIVSTGRLEALEQYYRTLQAVTPEHVRAAARKYLGESGRTTILMVQED